MTATPKPCPICKKPRSEEFAPFCSGRCRDRDLANWLTDAYTVPGEPASPGQMAPDDLDNEG